jgi:hypothetical protein
MMITVPIYVDVPLKVYVEVILEKNSAIEPPATGGSNMARAGYVGVYCCLSSGLATWYLSVVWTSLVMLQLYNGRFCSMVFQGGSIIIVDSGLPSNPLDAWDFNPQLENIGTTCKVQVKSLKAGVSPFYL